MGISDNYLERLNRRFRSMGSAVLALSGGLDSVFLAKALAMSGIRALAVTGRSATTPLRDLEDARRNARQLRMEHRVVDTSEMALEEFVSNPADRCYYCKDVLFAALTSIARDEGYACVIDGTNADDVHDHRPGRRAALKYGVVSPLLDCGFTKARIRESARALGMDIALKPASPCLSSRFAYGVRITPQGLRRVACAEEFVRDLLGIDELRVRQMEGGARVEVPDSHLPQLMASAGLVRERLISMGFGTVEIDPEGFSSGKLNRGIGDG